MKKIKVFIVDDSSAIIKLLEKTLKNEPDIEVVGFACNGEEAINKIPQIKPDVVTLDMEMPVMNGMEVIRYLVRKFPVPILVFSSITYEGAKITNQALREGALDFICKPDKYNDFEEIKKELIEKIKLISKIRMIRRIDIKPIKRIKKRISKPTPTVNKIIVIGVSTGGPRTLNELFYHLPDRLKYPIAVAQHMPEKFTKILAEQLNKITNYNVKEVEDNEAIKGSTIYIGQGGKNFLIKNNFTFSVVKGEGSALPSVDVLFKSASDVFKNNCIGIILTGMGKDGLEGAKKIKENNGKVIVQDKSSSIIYGMPAAVVENNLADEIADLKNMPDILMKYILKEELWNY